MKALEKPSSYLRVSGLNFVCLFKALSFATDQFVHRFIGRGGHLLRVVSLHARVAVSSLSLASVGIPLRRFYQSRWILVSARRISFHWYIPR